MVTNLNTTNNNKSSSSKVVYTIITTTIVAIIENKGRGLLMKWTWMKIGYMPGVDLILEMRLRVRIW